MMRNKFPLEENTNISICCPGLLLGPEKRCQLLTDTGRVRRAEAWLSLVGGGLREGLTPEQSHGSRRFKPAPPAGVCCARGRIAGEGVWAM